MNKPEIKPQHPFFSSGPCSKRPGWELNALSDAVLGRSHRAKGGKSKLNEVIVKSKQLLELPDDYLVGIVPASDTGAIEMAMWSLLGARGIDVCGWESFGLTWVKDITKQLKLENVNIHDIRESKAREKLNFWSGKIYEVKTPKIVVLGTDCGLGKRTTAKLIVENLQMNNVKSDMIYTGQTGWMQGWEYGFIFDSTLNDFVSGELERAIYECYISKKPEYILIEGQAALRNPSGPCGSEFLISANVDGVILQHSPKRMFYDGWEHVNAVMPSLDSEIKLIHSYVFNY